MRVGLRRARAGKEGQRLEVRGQRLESRMLKNSFPMKRLLGRNCNGCGSACGEVDGEKSLDLGGVAVDHVGLEAPLLHGGDGRLR